jgi:stage II sporulation protein D
MKKILMFISFCLFIILVVPFVILSCFRTGSVRKEIKPDIINTASADETVSDQDGKDNSASVSIKIKVNIAEKKTVKEMELEEYITGVVAGEMPYDFEIEALKSQSVAARTYAVTRMKTFGGKGCSSASGADICTNSGHCQEWISKEDYIKTHGTDADKHWEKIAAAVTATRGIILEYNSKPVLYPLFFSTSSGKTENSQDVFSSSYPYLRSVESSSEEVAPKFVSTVTISKNNFVKKLSGNGVKLSVSKIPSQVSILSRSQGGSVKTIQIGSKRFAGTQMRTMFGLNSANFEIAYTSDSVVFTVHGNGHGVGMSQWGANVMGKQGKKFDEILKHYYQGVELKNVTQAFPQLK